MTIEEENDMKHVIKSAIRECQLRGLKTTPDNNVSIQASYVYPITSGMVSLSKISS